MKVRWKFGIIAGLFLAIFALYPQFKMFYLRGAEWNGHYAYNDIDEVAYAAYLKALIDGRPRKNDPYTGRDDSPENPQPESLFSIQFAAPYTVAIPARVLGLPVTWAMTISGAVAAFLTALAIFWLVGMITGDSLYAMAGSLVVLCGGALFAGEGAIGEILGAGYSYPYFPGFRRYIPAMAFPAFFTMVGLVWRLVSGQWRETLVSGQQYLTPRSSANPPNQRGEFNKNDESHEEHESNQGSKIKNRRSAFPASLRSALTVSLAALAFGYTVFSYFYVWTTAFAWLGCLGLFWLIARPEGFWKDLKALTLLGLGCVAFLVPYFYLLSKRSHTMDDVQLLVLIHALDLTRVSEYVSFVTLVLLIGGIVLKKFEFADRAVLFAFSLAAVPIVVFNQQIVTGRSLQPIHYEVFIGNYVAGLALVVTAGIILEKVAFCYKRRSRVVFAAVALVAVGWGFVECHYTVRVLDEVNVIRDQALPVARRLAELARDEPDRHKSVVMDFGIAESDDLPTIAPQAVLWARHQHVFAGGTWQENKERYYQYLYYQGITPMQLADGMKTGGDFVSIIALFGWGRHTDRLNSEYKPLTFGEIDAEARKFAEFVRAFNPVNAGIPKLDFLIVPSDPAPELSNIDKWYERDAGERYGNYILYKLTLR